MQNHWKLKKSRYYCIVMACFFLLNNLVIVIISFPWLLKLSLWLFANSYIAYIVWRYVLMRHEQSIIAIRKNDNWMLQTATGAISCKLRGDSTVTQLVSILRFDCGKQTCKSVVVFRDAMTANDYRRLLITLSLRAAV